MPGGKRKLINNFRNFARWCSPILAALINKGAPANIGKVTIVKVFNNFDNCLLTFPNTNNFGFEVTQCLLWEQVHVDAACCNQHSVPKFASSGALKEHVECRRSGNAVRHHIKHL